MLQRMLDLLWLAFLPFFSWPQEQMKMPSLKSLQTEAMPRGRRSDRPSSRSWGGCEKQMLQCNIYKSMLGFISSPLFFKPNQTFTSFSTNSCKMHCISCNKFLTPRWIWSPLQDLMKDLKSELSRNLERLIIGLMLTPAEFDAKMMRKAMEVTWVCFVWACNWPQPTETWLHLSEFYRYWPKLWCGGSWQSFTAQTLRANKSCMIVIRHTVMLFSTFDQNSFILTRYSYFETVMKHHKGTCIPFRNILYILYILSCFDDDWWTFIWINCVPATHLQAVWFNNLQNIL